MNFVILCGGSGSRLWPKSREKMPKQFLKLNNKYTMLQNTILRVINVSDFINKDLNKKIIVICNKDHSFIVENQILELNINIEFNIIAEPKGNDSAPAICIASLFGNENDNTSTTIHKSIESSEKIRAGKYILGKILNSIRKQQ